MIVSLGRERMGRLHEINYPSLGFRAIIDMRDTSSAGWTHSCILDEREGTAQNKLPSLGFCGVPSLLTG